MLWRTGGVLPLIAAVVTMVMTIASVGALYEGLQFEARGIDTRAAILDRDIRKVRRDGRTETKYRVTFRYVVDGTEHDVTRTVSHRLYEASDVGSTRTVRYLDGRAHRVEFEIGSTMESGWAMRWVALFLGLLTLALLWWKGSRAVDAVRARKFGAQETVTVSEIAVSRHKTGKSYRLQWRDSNGGVGTSLSSGRRARYDPYPVGTQVDIFRGAKGRAWWVGDVGPRAEAATVPSVGKS